MNFEEIQKLAMDLPNSDRVSLAAEVLSYLPGVLVDTDDGIAKARRRSGELYEAPTAGYSWQEIKQAVLTLICLLFTCGFSFASPIPDFPFIVADGRASREVPPTNATVNFTVMAFSKSSEEATNTVQSALGKVITALKSEGVGENLISAHDLDKFAVRNRDKDMNNDTDILGYEVSREVQLKLPDLANYPKIIRVLMTANHVSKVESIFDTSKREEVEAELTAEACAKARKKADLLAKGAGVIIDRVYAVSDSQFENIGQQLGFGFSGSSAFGEAAPEMPLFAPSIIELHTSINILYKLAP
jgi:uncharacterized protein